MKPDLALVVAVLLAGCATTTEDGALTPGWERRLAAAFDDDACLPPRPHDPAFYAGPLIDGHIHVPSIPDSTPGFPEVWGDPADRSPILGVDVTIDRLVCQFAYEGTTRAFGFFSVYPGVDEPFAKLAARTMARYPETFIPFISPPDGPTGTVSVDRLRSMLALEPGLFRGFGEIGLYGNPEDPDGLAPDSGKLTAIYPLLREQGMVPYFHLGADHQAAFERALAANPDITFIFHGDQLVRYGDEGQDLSAIEEILARHPNVVYGIDELYGDVWLIQRKFTKEQFLDHFEEREPLLAKDLATWRGLIARHPDQVIWGTDRGAEVVWALEPEVGWTLNDYAREFIARLDPAVQERFAYKNVERVLSGRSGS